VTDVTEGLREEPVSTRGPRGPRGPGAGFLTEDPATAALDLKVGGVCAIVGAAVFLTVRLLHGDTPAADADAALAFVAVRPGYAAVHILALFAAAVTLAGLLALAGSLRRPAAWLLGRAGAASAVVGLAIFGAESTSEGLALPELAAAAARAAPGDRAELVRAARSVAAATHGPSLAAMALLVGLPLLLFGVALVLDAYPSWLGWVGAAVGAATLLTATGLYLAPDLVPGALLYGVLASVLAQLWLAGTGAAMLRRAAHPPGGR
jgi:hypothetical protein